MPEVGGDVKMMEVVPGVSGVDAERMSVDVDEVGLGEVGGGTGKGDVGWGRGGTGMRCGRCEVGLTCKCRVCGRGGGRDRPREMGGGEGRETWEGGCGGVVGLGWEGKGN